MFTPLGDDASNLADRIRSVVNNRSANAPRSQQRAIGLSEVGEVCVRKTSYKILDWEKTNPAKLSSITNALAQLLCDHARRMA